MPITERETHERFAKLGFSAAQGDRIAIDGLIALVGETLAHGDLASVTSLRLDLERLTESPNAQDVAWVQTCDVMLSGAERKLVLEAAEARQRREDHTVRQRVLSAITSSPSPVNVGWIAKATSVADHHVSRALRELSDENLVARAEPPAGEDKRKRWYEPPRASRTLLDDSVRSLESRPSADETEQQISVETTAAPIPRPQVPARSTPASSPTTAPDERTRLYRDEGVVLRSWRLGDADRLVLILTRDHGKVRAVAKGAQRGKSKIATSSLGPPANVAVQMYSGRELDIITSFEPIDSFRQIQGDAYKESRAASMLDAVDLLTGEREPNGAVLRLLLGALRTLAVADEPLVTPAFFLKLLVLDGSPPEVEKCVICGATEDLVSFDVESNGVACRSCGRGFHISSNAIVLVQRILGGRMGSAISEKFSADTHDVELVSTRAIARHLERTLGDTAGERHERSLT